MYVPYNVYNVRDWKLQRLLHMYVCTILSGFPCSSGAQVLDPSSLASPLIPGPSKITLIYQTFVYVHICTCMNDHYPFYPTISQCQWYQQVIGRALEVDPNQCESAPSQAIMIMIIPIHQMPQASSSLSELSSGSRCRIPKGWTYACNGAYILLGS